MSKKVEKRERRFVWLPGDIEVVKSKNQEVSKTKNTPSDKNPTKKKADE